ncbi:glycosyltransferase family 4 protein [Vibrio vulnificus]|uniref:glycosyltransferase family 4 protein n=1 Tax=Vibrio vulnificus TaxID=672 RepID=UPI001029A339|nr:glycosyltransferase family 4 protein [Vibrio vulnificus]MCA4001950.1 glycosyltransferase family 4 protein [Vibrio vulnificus]MCA4010849.1 glycosyltransferase family 4 protein [Vibrio vulnificus]MDK2606648.1 glycosyltransferase family 4 protein [Vibrio vulnificus]MDK2612738.1 glycosyltransferase family 4 protein [Vibrio vulnificus]MDK2629603.1 glycosyltransferase family 4 protein [Vibrio vulnificus]
MHLALIIDDYLPHSTRVAAKMFHELAKQFVLMGHEVTVITPDVEQKSKLEISEYDGVTVWRFSSGAIKDIGKVKRAINETLLSTKAWSAISGKIAPDTFDGVIYYSPSIFFGSLIKRLKARCQCPSYLILRDLFPQWIIDAGMVKQGSAIERYFRFFETRSYQQADTIGLMSEKNLELFNNLTDGRYPTEILRNWAALEPHKSRENSKFKIKLGLENKVVFFYGGNMGHAQDMSNLMRLAKAMQPYRDAHFLFIGQGDEVELINRLASDWNLTNFSYLPSVNQEVFKDILAEMDVGLFSLAANHTAHNFPGKLLGYMVQSLPILGSVNRCNDLFDIINDNNAGMISINGDDDDLFNNALSLYENLTLRKETGSNAYHLLKQEFSVQAAAKAILEALKE